MPRHPSGFTLIEILFALTLIAILVGVGTASFTSFTTDAKKAVTREKLNALKEAIVGDSRMVSGGKYVKQGYEAHCLAPPTTLTDLRTQPGSGTCASAYDPFTKRGWRGPYVTTTDSDWNKDAWGVTIEYYVSGAFTRTIRSCGPDKNCSATTDNITITY